MYMLAKNAKSKTRNENIDAIDVSATNALIRMISSLFSLRSSLIFRFFFLSEMASFSFDFSIWRFSDVYAWKWMWLAHPVSH